MWKATPAAERFSMTFKIAFLISLRADDTEGEFGFKFFRTSCIHRAQEEAGAIFELFIRTARIEAQEPEMIQMCQIVKVVNNHAYHFVLLSPNKISV